MEAYKFETTVLDNGLISIPEMSKYKNQKIEVIVMLHAAKERQKAKLPIDDFLDKWSGNFSKVDTDDIRYNALIEKHG